MMASLFERIRGFKPGDLFPLDGEGVVSVSSLRYEDREELDEREIDEGVWLPDIFSPVRYMAFV